MIEHIAFLRKVRNTRADWIYLYNNKLGAFTSEPGEIPYQMGSVVEHIMHIAELDENSGLVIVSPHANAESLQGLQILFPEVFFMPIIDSTTAQFFDKAISGNIPVPRRNHPEVLYIGCDASGGHSDKEDGRIVPAAWAWVSEGVTGRYGVGEAGNVSVNIAEYQALMNAIIANASDPAQKLHLYSDSLTAVEMFNYDVAEQIVPREARKHGLVSLTREVMNIIKIREVEVEWVKGHRNHRLNQVADSISRLARQRFNAGHSYEDFKLELDSIYSTFNLLASVKN